MKWDEETEVLVIGFGGAGRVPAITARDAGAEVLIVEKMDRGGGNTNISMGGFLCLRDLEGGMQYLESLGNRVSQIVEPEMIRIFADECLKNREWFESRGARTHVDGGAAFPQLPGSEAIEKRMVTGSNTAEENAFWNFLRCGVEERQIPIWSNAPAEDLLTDAGGMIIGAVIRNAGKE